jgi:hypothetical protein
MIGEVIKIKKQFQLLEFGAQINRLHEVLKLFINIKLNAIIILFNN